MKPLMKPPLKWYGGKSFLMPTMLKLVPSHKTYVEVFGGSGSFLFAKEPKRVEVYNDIESELINFFKVLRTGYQAKELKRLIDLTPYSREEYSKLKQDEAFVNDLVERARRFYILVKQSFNGKYKSSWSTSKVRNSATTFFNTFADVEKYIERLHRVYIESLDFRELMPKYDSPETFFYLDPPYLPETRVSQNDYRNELSPDDHDDLLNIIKEVKGKVLLSGYASNFYDNALVGWNRIESEQASHATNGISKADGISKAEKPKRTEVLWFNYEAPDAGEIYK